MIDIHLYCQRYENYNGFAIILDFTAHWAIQNEQMANVWNFNIESKLSHVKLKTDLISKSNKIFKRSPYA